MDDAYMQARSANVKGIAHRLICSLQGKDAEGKISYGSSPYIERN